MESAAEGLVRLSDPASQPVVAVTTALKPSHALREQAIQLAACWHWNMLRRGNTPLPELFAEHPAIERLVVVQSDRLLLVSRDGWELRFHPNMAYLRVGNVLRGGRDWLLEAAQLRQGDTVLDATLGFAAEAIVCAHAVGETGRVDGVEASDSVACVVEDGLQRLETASRLLNDTMRRVRVVAAGHHLEWMRTCADRSYDVVCFDPFFETPLSEEENLSVLRAFGAHLPLTRESIGEAIRIARRRIVVKAPKWSSLFDELGIEERVGSRSGKVSYGILRINAH
jgi:16S rRNA (guanine1516-N2)-methyltransferase